VTILQRLTEEFPAVPRYRLDLTVMLRSIGVTELLEGRLDHATQPLQESLRHAEKLIQQYPGNEQYVAERDDTTRVIEHLEKQQKSEKQQESDERP
jgi:hypothetical protein